jgi:amino acid transporter
MDNYTFDWIQMCNYVYSCKFILLIHKLMDVCFLFLLFVSFLGGFGGIILFIMRKKEEGGERRGRRSDGPIFYTTTTGTSYYLYRHTGTLVTVVLYCNTR